MLVERSGGYFELDASLSRHMHLHRRD